jgi:epoxyqueuosine reductase
MNEIDFAALAHNIKKWGRDLGFDEVGIAGIDLSAQEAGLLDWLSRGYHGDMDYMARHGARRARPAELVPGTHSVISVRLNYLPSRARDSWQVIADPDRAFISRYALGRDYHKVLRGKLQTLAEKIQTATGEYRYRAFTDSAPVMEVALAHKAGLGWRGKHTLLLTREAGSMFFLGELYTDLPLPADTSGAEHCGSCRKCIDICPTHAIVAPYRLDARRCISYLTIEHKGSIPEALRPLIGNRIYGCDDCQLVCPWNKFAHVARETDFAARHSLDDIALLELFSWSEQDFNDRLAGSAIRRIGHAQWLRNIAVALGNALAVTPESDPRRAAIVAVLEGRRYHANALVAEHVVWALAQLSTPHTAQACQ